METQPRSARPPPRFADTPFDAAMARIDIHRWHNPERGLAE
jgi:hypothetical protein